MGSWQEDVLARVNMGLIAGPSPVTVDNTATGQTLAALLGADLHAGLRRLTLVPASAGIFWAAGSGDDAAEALPAGGVELEANKAQADALKFFAAGNIAMTVVQEG